MNRIEPGPFDLLPVPPTLATHVTTVGASPRVHGYDVENDLARHYALHEMVFLALTGELPTEGASAALAVAAMFAAPISAAEAPAHAAVVVQVCAAPPRSVVATAALGLAEQAQHIIDEHAPFLAWLDKPEGEVPPVARGGEEDGGAVRRLREALSGVPLAIPGLDRGISRSAAILAVLHAAGLVRPAALVAFWTWARLPFATAEGFAWKAGAVPSYPMRMPSFRYEEDGR